MNRRCWAVGGWLAAVLVVCLASPALARMHAPYRGHRIAPATVAPLDGFTAPAGAYSFRKLKSTYAGPAVKLRRASDNAVQDTGFAGDDFNTSAAATFCASTTCFLDTWYDQSGLARHVTQANLVQQPSYVANCIGDKPCARSPTNQGMFSAANVTPAAGPASFSAVMKVDATGGLCTGIQAASQQLGINGSVWLLYNGGLLAVTTPEGAWHVSNGVINNAASVLNIDGVETTGSMAPVTTAGLVGVAGGNTVPCNFTEAVWWNNYALTSGERVALASNQHDYWTPLPLDAFTTPAAAYSLRKLKSSYMGPGIRLRRASDNATQDINFLGFTGFTGAPIDTAAAATFCAATSCFIATWYDQSGNGRDLAQGTAANQLTYIANCIGSLPCARETTAAQTMSSGSVSWTARTTLSFVGQRSAGPTVACYYLGRNAAWFASDAVSGQYAVSDFVTNLYATAAEGAWHAATAVVDGAASVLRLDASETTGTIAGAAGVQNAWVFPFGASGSTCNLVEAVIWDNYALTAAERAALTVNQKSFWGLP